MFAGRRRRSSNIRVMQLFHELKQQFPTVPDHVVTSCITTHAHSSSPNRDSTIREILESAAAVLSNNQEPMGRSPPEPTPTTPATPDLTKDSPTNPQPPSLPPPITSTTSSPPPKPVSRDPPLPRPPPFSPHAAAEKRKPRRPTTVMNDSESDVNRNIVKGGGVTFSKKFESVSVNASDQRVAKSTIGKSSFFVKRPDHLSIRPQAQVEFPKKPAADTSPSFNIQLSEKCKDVHKLLNADHVTSDKPPRSPLTARRPMGSKNSSPCAPARSPLASPDAVKRLPSEEAAAKRTTASTPTQTTDTLLGSQSVNLSLNVNCSMVQSPMASPTLSKRMSVLQVTPQQPWLPEQPGNQATSPRSYTSVNLTLRPPSAEPQAPIDITSQNSSLTYSTSSFDSHKGLQSTLQITVGPGGGSVSSVRVRPNSSYLPEGRVEDVLPVRAGSLNNLSTSNEPPVILKQQARMERLRIELKTEKANLVVMQQEVADLQRNHVKAIEHKIDAEVETQLRKEIKHLQYQCEQLALEVDKKTIGRTHEDFYQNIYTGPRVPLDFPNRGRRPNAQRDHQQRISYPQQTPQVPFPEYEGPKWNCHLCTFLNHPDLDKCEQCEMPRILHGKLPSNPNISLTMVQQPQPSSPNNNNNNYSLTPSQSLPAMAQNNRQPISRPIGFNFNNDLHLLTQALSSRNNRFKRPNS